MAKSRIKGREKSKEQAKLRITTMLRDELSQDDSREAQNDEPSDPPEPAERPEEKWEANDHFRGDSEEEYDVSRSVDPQAVVSCLLSSIPHAQWRVTLKDGDVSVEPIKSDRRSRDTNLASRRKAVLTLAARAQHNYLKNAEIDNLKILKTKDILKRIIAEWAEPEVVLAYKDRKVDISSDIGGQFFYDPRGGLHAVRFLFQDDVCGFALARVYQALNDIVNTECINKIFLTDEEVSERLNKLFESTKFTGKKVARWRETKHEWSVKRLFLPKREDREQAVCASKRQQN